MDSETAFFEVFVTANGAGMSVTDGPFNETKEVIGGYFTIRADSWDEAVRIAESCPHLENNGMVEIRQIEDTGE